MKLLGAACCPVCPGARAKFEAALFGCRALEREGRFLKINECCNDIGRGRRGQGGRRAFECLPNGSTGCACRPSFCGGQTNQTYRWMPELAQPCRLPPPPSPRSRSEALPSPPRLRLPRTCPPPGVLC